MNKFINFSSKINRGLVFNNEDDQLVKRCQEGDSLAFEQLVHKYKKRAYRIAYQIVRDQEDAIDISQEAFIRVYRSLSKFRRRSNFSTWLYRIVVNLSLDFRRQRKHLNSVALDDEILVKEENLNIIKPPKKSNPVDFLEAKELGTKVKEAIANLPEHHRMVVTLCDVEGLSYRAIAKILNCSLGTVMSRLYYARRKLREELRHFL